MTKNFKFLIIPVLFFGLPFFAHASCTSTNKIDFIARDPNGGFIPNVHVDVYKQELDANGNPKPTTHFTSATTDATLGVAHLSFKNTLDSDTYVIKVQSVSKDNATYWYYSNTYSCGQNATVDKKLSGIAFTLHDANGNLLTNTSFNVYSQLYDSNGKPLNQRKELLATLNTGYTGGAKVYLPQGSVRSIDGSLSDHYTLELVRPSAKFYFYNISVLDGQLTTLDYYVSSLHVRLQDTTAAPFPSGTQVEVYNQDIDSNNNNIKGTKIGTFNIGDDGWGTFEIPAGIYALAVKGKTGQYQNFWDIEAIDGRSTEYTLTPDQSWTPSDGSCQTTSNLIITVRSYSNSSLNGLKYEVYEQNAGINGIPVAGTRINGGTFDASGRVVINFKPDPRKTYALKVYDKNANLGDFWFFDAARFVCGYDRAITESLPVLKLVMRDANGALKKNFNFSLYMQDYDADNNPVIEDSNLIANLKTDNTGIARVFLTPYNTYRYETGIYAIESKDANNNNAVSYNIHMYPDKDTVYQYAFTGLSADLRNASGVLVPNREIHFYNQVGSGSGRSLGNLLTKIKTDKNGHFSLEVPAGTYAVGVLDDFNQENIFWGFVLKDGKINTAKIITGLNKISVTAVQGDLIATGAAVKIYNLVSDDGHNYYKDEEIGTLKLSSGKNASVSLVPGYYLASYFDKTGKEYGRYFRAANGVITTVKITTSSTNRIASNRIFKIK